MKGWSSFLLPKTIEGYRSSFEFPARSTWELLINWRQLRKEVATFRSILKSQLNVVRFGSWQSQLKAERFRCLGPKSHFNVAGLAPIVMVWNYGLSWSWTNSHWWARHDKLITWRGSRHLWFFYYFLTFVFWWNTTFGKEKNSKIYVAYRFGFVHLFNIFFIRVGTLKPKNRRTA